MENKTFKTTATTIQLLEGTTINDTHLPPIKSECLSLLLCLWWEKINAGKYCIQYPKNAEMKTK